MKKAISVIIFLFTALFTVSGASALSGAGPDPVMRVCLLDNADRVHLVLKRPFIINDLDSKKVLMEEGFLNVNVSATKSGIRIGQKLTKVNGIRIEVPDKPGIYIDGKRFRGAVEIIRKENSKIMVVNHIPLEEYLYGVLYHEVSHRWPAEALKAQAIACRTFALYQARQNKLQSYDLRSDIYSQVYGGSAFEKYSTTKAVNATKGTVLVYNGDIFPAYYHATCAGMTESASRLWNIDLAPLKGGVRCAFCRSSPHYRWAKDIPLWELKNKLVDNGYKIGGIESVSILSKNNSGRVERLEIKDSSGVSVILTGKEFRQLMGPNELRSTKFDAVTKWNFLVVTGFGWGHGAGMCQWGAYGMSKEGKKTEDILKFYYPGSEISALDKLPSR